MKQFTDWHNVFSISINIELIMYGYVSFCISQGGDAVDVSWVVMADGGNVIADESKKLGCLNFFTLTKKLSEIDLPECEDSSMSRSWSISYYDKEGNRIKGNGIGYWDINVLSQIVDLIDELSGDTGITEWLHNIIEA